MSAHHEWPGFSLQAIGGPTALLGYAGWRLLTDPTLDPPGRYQSASAVLTKLAGPAVAPDQLGRIDAVLLSHDHHVDNLDAAGRVLLTRAGRVVTTVVAAQRLGLAATGLQPYDTVELARAGAGPVQVTAVPAEHGPPAVAPRTGPVIGFVLRADELPTVYVSGDNASLDVVGEIARRVGPVDVAVLFAGAAQIPEAYGDAHLTLTAEAAAQAALILDTPTVIPLHHDGWQHFTQGHDELRHAFARAGIADRLQLASGGVTVVPIRTNPGSP